MKRLNTTFRAIGFIFFILLSHSIQAQSLTQIIGKVVDSDNKPIELVSIGAKGTSSGTYTDENGSFTISLPRGNYNILVDYVGNHTEKSVSVKSDATINLGDIVLKVTEQQLNEVTVNAMIKKFAEKKSDYVSRMPLDNLENPQVYTVIPKELLKEQLAIDFKNVLTASPGVSAPTLGLGSGGTGMSMRLRGFAGANGAGAIRNGMATNYVSMSDPANLESIEVIKGPSSTLFGTNLISYGGLVNRVTKKAHEQQAGEFSFTAGAWDLYRLTADYNTPLDKKKNVLFRINAAGHKENSYKDYGVNNNFMIAPTLTVKASDRLVLNFDAEYFKSNMTTSYINILDKSITNLNQLNWDWKKSFASDKVNSKSDVFNAFGEAKYKLSDKWTSQTLLSYSYTKNKANYIFLDVASKDSLSRRVMYIPSTFHTQQVQQNFNGDFYIGKFRNRVLAGIDFTRLTTTDTRTTVSPYDGKKIGIHESVPPIDKNVLEEKVAAADNLKKPSENNRHTQTYSAYVSDVFNISDRLDVMAALRFDRFDDVNNSYLQTSWSPKFGAVYQVVKNQVSVFANYMNGFKNVAPAAGDPEGTIKAFKPEHAIQWEGGLKLEFFNRRLNSTISVYHIKVDNRVRKIVPNEEDILEHPDYDSYFVQDASQVSKGVELDIIANPIPGLRLIAGYAFNDNKYEKSDVDGKREVGTPKHLANFWVSYQFVYGSIKGLGAGIGGNFASSSYLDTQNNCTVSGYGKLDASIFYDYSSFRVSGKINNLTNKKYWLGDYYAETQAPRQILGSISYRF